MSVSDITSHLTLQTSHRGSTNNIDNLDDLSSPATNIDLYLQESEETELV